ncbi:MAG: flagellar basal body rod C-terminal domain-containing protein [Candidatus Margulisiibacteriota bacterium]
MFNALPMLQNSISATSEAMTLLSTDAQAFQTDGYKQQQYTFSSIFNSEVNAIGGRYGRYGGAHNQTMSQGVTLIPMGYDMSQGGIKSAQPLNAAISGKGFFVVQSENSLQNLLTRASDFIFAADGTLIDIFGRRVKGYRVNNGVADKTEMVDIKLDPNSYNLSDVGFEDNGILTTNYQARQAAIDNGQSGDTLPQGEQTFQLALASVPNPSQMEMAQGNAFITTLKSGEINYYGVANEGNLGSVIGASSESSNVNPAETTVTGIQLQRGYNATQAALTMTNRFLTQIMEVAGKA